MFARSILIVASGEDKAKAVYDVLRQWLSAQHLSHINCTAAIADEAALAFAQLGKVWLIQSFLKVSKSLEKYLPRKTKLIHENGSFFLQRRRKRIISPILIVLVVQLLIAKRPGS